MKKGEIAEGRIEEVRFPNKGVMHTGDGESCIVKNVLPGQKVRARITKKKGRSLVGNVLEIVERAENEIESLCPHFPECGGCSYQNISPEDALAMKEKQVKDLIGPEHEDAWLTAIPSPSPEAYRNKMEYSFGDSYKGGPLTLGLHKKGSFYDIVEIPGCRITHKDFGLITNRVQDYCRSRGYGYYHRLSHEGLLRHLLVRRSHSTGEILLGIVTTSQEEVNFSPLLEEIKALPLDGKLTGFIHIINDSPSDAVKCDESRLLYGQEYFYEEILGLKFRITLFSFFQTNSAGAERLYLAAREMLLDGQYECGKSHIRADAGLDGGEKAAYGDSVAKGRETGMDASGPVVYDLYSGTGTIAQMMSPSAGRVYGVEIVEEAVEAARSNAKSNGLTNCFFIAGDVLKVLDDIEEKPDLIILDPPRDGIHPKALRHIISYGVDRLIYISCKPTSLARDLEAFYAGGYTLSSIRVCDMFPGTVHVESVVLITRKDK